MAQEERKEIETEGESGGDGVGRPRLDQGGDGAADDDADYHEDPDWSPSNPWDT